MNSLEDELQNALITANAVREGATASATLTFRYTPSFIGFQGHFRNAPILPGVCLLQSLRVGLEKAWATPLRLTDILNAKFISPVHPSETLLFAVTETARSPHAISVKTKVTRDSQRVAELSVQLEPIPLQ